MYTQLYGDELYGRLPSKEWNRMEWNIRPAYAVN
jgi:hypothetical protein